MFIFIAILWYLQLMIPKVSPTTTELDTLLKNGTQAVKQHNAVQVLKLNEVQSFMKSSTETQFRNRIEQWTSDKPEPLLD
jgi:hypothetical protein